MVTARRLVSVCGKPAAFVAMLKLPAHREEMMGKLHLLQLRYSVTKLLPSGGRFETFPARLFCYTYAKLPLSGTLVHPTTERSFAPRMSISDEMAGVKLRAGDLR